MERGVQMLEIKDIGKIDIPEKFGLGMYDDTVEMDDLVWELESQDEAVFCTNGASRFVVVSDNWDRVVKISFNYVIDEETGEIEEFKTKDYCSNEVFYYDMAKEWGVEKAFTDIRLEGYTNNGKGHPYYSAERVISNCCFEFSDESKKQAQECYYNPFIDNIDFVASIIEFYGKDFWLKLLDFIEYYGIRDLHNGNLGHREDGSPVILDYAGFNE